MLGVHATGIAMAQHRSVGQPARWPALAALLLVLAGTVRIASTWTVFNHVIDEPDTIAPGMEYLSIGRFLYEDTHPPVGRVVSAIGPFLAGERFHPGPDSYSEGYRILGHGEHYDRTLALARAGSLLFFWIASLVTYLWAKRTAGAGAAVLATLLFTTLPPILAHCGLATTDSSLCAMTAAAALASLYWADSPTRRRSIALGALTALAFCSKFSALLYLPAAWIAMMAVYLIGRRQNPMSLVREAWARRRPIALAAVALCLAIWAIYAFTFGRVDFLHLRLPAPRFFSGIHSVWLHSQRGHPAYLLGERSSTGFWYYFPTIFALKTPLGMLALVALSPLLAIWRGRWRMLLPLAFSIGILLISMRGHIDLGVRYLLPVYVGFSVFCACAAIGTRNLAAKIAVVVLIGWQIVSGDLAHPNYLAYTNEITGSHPERFLADSDLDWGQDMKRLNQFLIDHNATEVTFSPFNRTYPMAGHDMLPMLPGATDHPSPGWNAVSVTIWKVFGYPAWAGQYPPQYNIGHSILVWHFPDGGN